MTLLYKGKTKDLYQREDQTTYFYFKDDVTGKDGTFDPGANQVDSTMKGAGLANILISTYFFEKLKEKGISTHFISSDIEKKEMNIQQAEVFGEGLEVICRWRAVGSFIRRYGLYAKEGQELDAYVEFTLKDDERDDPLINQEALEKLGLLQTDQYHEIKELMRTTSKFIKEDLADKGLELIDIKLEFGRLANQKDIVVIDEISAGNMRVYKDGAYVQPLELVKYFNDTL